jgi:hypothetical protein
VFTFELTL